MKKTVLKWTLPSIPLAVTILLYMILPHFPGFTEYVFSRGIFRMISIPLGFITSKIPFSLTEILVITSFPLFTVLLVFFIRRFKKSDNNKEFAKSVAKRTYIVISCLFLMYSIMHGYNYYRKPIAEIMKLESFEITEYELEELCIELAKKASYYRSLCEEDENGVFTFGSSDGEVMKQAKNGYDNLSVLFPDLWCWVSRGKSVMLSHYWSYTGIVGMYFPFFAEANVNVDVKDLHIPFTLTHELAHTMGFAREDEANFLAVIACINNDDVRFKYIGYYTAFKNCAKKLDPLYFVSASFSGPYFSEGWDYISEAIKRDLNSNQTYWTELYEENEFVEAIASAATEINDNFISSHGVTEGVESYNMYSDILVDYFYKYGIEGV